MCEGLLQLMASELEAAKREAQEEVWKEAQKEAQEAAKATAQIAFMKGLDFLLIHELVPSLSEAELRTI